MGGKEENGVAVIGGGDMGAGGPIPPNELWYKELGRSECESALNAVVVW